MENGFLDSGALARLGLRCIGVDVQIDAAATIYGVGRISCGSHIRVDAGTILSAGRDGIGIGDHVHLSAQVCLLGAARIELQSFVGISAGTILFSSNDDYSGAALTGPTVPDDLRHISSAPVVLEEHAIIGARSVILPGVRIGRGAAVGALSLVRDDIPPFAIAVGSPARVVGKRSRKLLELEEELRAREANA